MSKILRILTIAGSDSGGGAGIQADLKTISAHHCFGMSAITAVTAQNTVGVQAIEPVSPACVSAQIASVVQDIGVDAIKVGMLFSKEIVECVAKELQKLTVPIVVDPVLVSSTGALLLQEEAICALKEKLFPIATLLTPNLEEAKVLDYHGPHVLITGEGDDCLGGKRWFREQTLASLNTHGTGCTLSTAIACNLAKGDSVIDAIEKAKVFVTKCLRMHSHLILGNGVGPVQPLLCEGM